MELPEDAVSFDRLVAAPALRAQVYERLRKEIVTGNLPPGARISPAETARRYGISPMPVRDALGLLEQEGLVERAARRWTRVVELSPALVEELVPLVSLLEQYGVSSAAAVADPAIAELRGANAELREAIEAGDVRSASEADSRFHEGLVELAENRSLERALSEARTRLRLLRPQVMKRDGAFDSVADHDQIVECLEEGNRKAAARALAKNWRRGLARFRASQATRPDD